MFTMEKQSALMKYLLSIDKRKFDEYGDYAWRLGDRAEMWGRWNSWLSAKKLRKGR